MIQRLEESVQQGRAAREGIETEIREKLSTEYEWKIKELSFQKEQLEQKLKESGLRPSPEAGGGGHPNPRLLPILRAQTSRSPKSRNSSTTPVRLFPTSSARMPSDRNWKPTAAAWGFDPHRSWKKPQTAPSHVGSGIAQFESLVNEPDRRRRVLLLDDKRKI